MDKDPLERVLDLTKKIREVFPPEGDKTSVKLDPRIRDGLKALGKKGETYDDIIERLIMAWHLYQAGKPWPTVWPR